MSTINKAKQEWLYQVLERPHITEKATRIADKANQVVFRVIADADKADVKQAVEMIYKVTVVGVQTLWQKPKVKRRGTITGRRAGWKKAIVTLKTGDEINFAHAPEGAKAS